jgi:hypothetical protein
MPDLERRSQKSDRQLADSPWFWLSLFLAAALVALMVVSPKFAHRQERLERMNDTREQIARQSADAESRVDGHDMRAEAPRPGSPRSSLGPLGMVISLLLALSAIAAGVVSYLRTLARRHEEAPPRATK